MQSALVVLNSLETSHEKNKKESLLVFILNLYMTNNLINSSGRYHVFASMTFDKVIFSKNLTQVGNIKHRQGRTQCHVLNQIDYRYAHDQSVNPR